MQVSDIQKKINQLKEDLIFWENHLKEIQRYCDHSFEGEHLYKKCLHCEKIEALYY
ncbi:serine protease [Alkalihalobacillus sp. MEB130]|uniref:serine protease n=1 Tax=Alkalihalobacillus sp. MEB130 TaxID=2976704 RepID=UPI0028DE3C2B|nr:serine protease [Alkalihalobacillus sp. MEB130]MDT8861656.1 serine protease [Alkalihalobacillus sp. MEB130]